MMTSCQISLNVAGIVVIEIVFHDRYRVIVEVLIVVEYRLLESLVDDDNCKLNVTSYVLERFVMDALKLAVFDALPTDDESEFEVTFKKQ